MRETLFRGKRTDNGEWVEGYLFIDMYLEVCTIQGFNYYTDENGLQRECFSVDVIPETVGEFTGLTDKNGKKIWEGDVVEVKTSSNEGETNEITRVGYDSKSCGFFPMIWETSCDGCDCYFRIKEIEVIGNIHDNSEILK